VTTYTFKSARYANPLNTSAIADTEEAGSIIVNEAEMPEEWKQLKKLKLLKPVRKRKSPEVTNAPRVVRASGKPVRRSKKG
jgi:hypothetical protein